MRTWILYSALLICCYINPDAKLSFGNRMICYCLGFIGFAFDIFEINEKVKGK